MTRADEDAQNIKPFADEAAAQRIGELSVENRLDRVSLYGSLDLTRDQRGLRRAQDLKRIVDAVVRTLAAEANLPEAVAGPEEPQTVKNPFAWLSIFNEDAFRIFSHEGITDWLREEKHVSSPCPDCTLASVLIH